MIDFRVMTFRDAYALFRQKSQLICERLKPGTVTEAPEEPFSADGGEYFWRSFLTAHLDAVRNSLGYFAPMLYFPGFIVKADGTFAAPGDYFCTLGLNEYGFPIKPGLDSFGLKGVLYYQDIFHILGYEDLRPSLPYYDERARFLILQRKNASDFLSRLWLFLSKALYVEARFDEPVSETGDNRTYKLTLNSLDLPPDWE